MVKTLFGLYEVHFVNDQFLSSALFDHPVLNLANYLIEFDTFHFLIAKLLFPITKCLERLPLDQNFTFPRAARAFLS